MTDYIQDLFRHMREELETSLHRTLAGNWTNGRSESRLAPYLGRPQAFRWYDRLKRGLSAYEG
jgi:hypothetical protein